MLRKGDKKSKQIELLLHQQRGGVYLKRLMEILSEKHKEVRIVEEQERTKREAIQAVKETFLKRLDILEKTANEILREKLRLYRQAVEKELSIIDKAIKENDMELLKLGLSSLISTLNMDLIGDDIEKLGRALRNKNEEIEI